MSKPKVFISYSHKDEEWKDRLVTHLGVLKEEGILDLWDDRRIEAGEDWYRFERNHVYRHTRGYANIRGGLPFGMRPTLPGYG